MTEEIHVSFEGDCPICRNNHTLTADHKLPYHYMRLQIRGKLQPCVGVGREASNIRRVEKSYSELIPPIEFPKLPPKSDVFSKKYTDEV